MYEVCLRFYTSLVIFELEGATSGDEVGDDSQMSANGRGFKQGRSLDPKGDRRIEDSRVPEGATPAVPGC